MGDLDATLARIDAVLAEGEVDEYPWHDAAVWTQGGGWGEEPHPVYGERDPADPPWVIDTPTADERQDWV